MNTVTRMVLVPEDQHKSSTEDIATDFSPIMNSSLPTDIKVRLMNQLLMKNSTKKESRKRRIENKLKERVKKRFQILKALEQEQIKQPSDLQDQYQMIKEYERLHPKDNQRELLSHSDDDHVDDADDEETIVGSDSDSEGSYYSTVDAMQRQKDGIKDNLRKIHKMAGSSKELQENNNSQKNPISLLLSLKSHDDLVAADNKILDQGAKIKGSDIEKVTEYLLTKNWKGKAPNGTGAVLHYIQESKLFMKHLIKNPEALDRLKSAKLSWIAASNISNENITRRKPRAHLEE